MTAKAIPIIKGAATGEAKGFAGSRVDQITRAIKLLIKNSVKNRYPRFVWSAFGNEHRTLPGPPLKLKDVTPSDTNFAFKAQICCLY